MTHSDDKTRFLKQQGLLHPRPQAVLDSLFADSDFFDPRDLVLVKVEMLRCVRIEQATVTEATGRFGLSRPSFYQAQKRLSEHGLLGLIPSPRGPHKPHKLTEKVRQFLLQQQAEHPNLSPNDLVVQVKKRWGICVHPRSIERVLHPCGQKKGRKPTTGT